MESLITRWQESQKITSESIAFREARSL